MCVSARSKKSFLFAGMSSLCLMAAQPGNAQTAPTPSTPAQATDNASAPSNDGLEVITVVGEKKETALQKAPLSITSLSAETLDQDNVKSVADLNTLVPGLTVAKNEGYQTSIAIRGVGFEADQNDSAQPSVSFHLDGIYIASPIALNQNFLDIDHVEVLRGPQGTVFGQNSTGGAINVITKAPNFDGVSGNGDVSYGTYNLFNSRASVNVPINDKVAVRISAQQSQHDGFAEATRVPGQPHYGLDDEDNSAGRLQVLLAPTDDFTALLRAQYYRSDTHDGEQKNVLDPLSDPRKTSEDFPDKYAMRHQLDSLTLQWDLPWFSVKSLTSLQLLKEEQEIDNDHMYYGFYVPHDIVPLTDHRQKTFTQEVNLTSNPGGTIDWIAGAFLLNDVNKPRFFEFYAPTASDVFSYPATLPTSQPLPSDVGFVTESRLTRTSGSLYGQATYHLLDSLRVTGGLRYTHEHASAYVSDYWDHYAPASQYVTSGQAVTGKAEIDYDLAPKNMVYVSYSKGYKPGGTNLNQSAEMVSAIFRPEKVDAYELGSKNQFLGDKLRINAAGFYYDYSNYQFQAEDPVPFQGGVANVPSAYIEGVESDFSALLPDHLRLDGNMSLERGEFTSDYLALDAAAAATATAQAAALGYSAFDPRTIAMRAAAAQNLNHESLPKLPHLQGAVSLTHTLDMGDHGTLTSKMEYQYRGSYIYRVFNNSALDRVPMYGLWNLYFSYAPPEGNWTIDLIATNLFDRAGIDSRFTNAFGIQTTVQQYVPPRQVIAKVAYTF